MSNIANLEYISIYKNKIINLLLKNQNLIKLINPSPSKYKELDIIDVLLGGKWIIDKKEHIEQGYIFDHDFVTDTTTEEKTFIFVEAVPSNVYNNMFVDFNLFICIFSHKSLIRISDKTIPNVNDIKSMGFFTGNRGNRVDILCSIIDGILNGNNKIPGIGSINPAERDYVTLYCPNNKYYGKCLKYKIKNLNEIEDNCEN